MHVPDIGTEDLMHELKAVVSATEDLLKATAGDASERVAKARGRTEDSLRRARASLSKMEQRLVTRARAASKATNRYVHENPWPPIGVVAGAAFIFGVLIGRR